MEPTPASALQTPDRAAPAHPEKGKEVREPFRNCSASFAGKLPPAQHLHVFHARGMA